MEWEVRRRRGGRDEGEGREETEERRQRRVGEQERRSGRMEINALHDV